MLGQQYSRTFARKLARETLAQLFRKKGHLRIQFKEPDPVKGISEPRIIAKPFPKYPEELRAAGREGLFSFLGIVTRQGKFDPSRWIVLECLNPFFARNALKTIFENWEFAPAKMGTQAVDILAVVEVAFRLYAR
jgi:hypothetical protein